MKLSTTFIIPLLTTTATALQIPAPIDFQPFFAALPASLHEYIPASLLNTTIQEHDLLRRQNSDSCPDGTDSCINLGAPGLCCASNAVCSADYGGYVACCPSGAACSGRVSGVITAGTISDGQVVGGAAATTGGSDVGSGGLVTANPTTTTGAFETASQTTASSNNGGLVVATTTQQSTVGGADSAGSGFVVDGTSTVATPGFGRKNAQVVSVVLRRTDVLY
jgi:hypothetical protein